MKKLEEIKIVFDYEYFKQLLKEKNLKSKDIAELINVCSDRISKYLNGHAMPSIDTLYKLAVFLGVPMEDLLKEV